MDPDFWLARWQQREIGFHQAEINPLLTRHWHRLCLMPGARVLVPLCGKSQDMLWLAAQGLEVIGCELSQVAVEEFFVDHGLTPTQTDHGTLKRYQAGSISLWCGDFFALQPENIGPIQAIYDRAALVALPQKMRQAYAQQIKQLASNTAQLVITFDYNQEHVSGPPFSIPPQQVAEFYRDTFSCEVLESNNLMASPEAERWQSKGLTSIHEIACLLNPL